MKLARFTLTPDNNGIDKKGTAFDLSTCFNFIGMDFDIVNRELQLRWIKGSSDQIPATHPDELALEFTDVSLFKLRERDTDASFHDDECLTSIGFMDNTKTSGFSDKYTAEPQENANHLCLEFKSGLALKIAAENASLMTKSRV